MFIMLGGAPYLLLKTHDVNYQLGSAFLLRQCDLAYCCSRISSIRHPLAKVALRQAPLSTRSTSKESYLWESKRYSG